MRLGYLDAEAPPGCAVEVDAGPAGATWSVTNESPAPLAVDRVALRWHVPSTPTHMFRNGWQSWSASGGGPVSERPARSDMVTVIADGSDATCVGFAGGGGHDGTLRLDGRTLRADAILGGVVLAPGERRELQPVRIEAGDPTRTLGHWAAWAAARAGARTSAPYRTGWCSWYQYFDDVTERAIREDLARAADWPIEVFQLDDGYQKAIGDWLETSDAFPSPLERLAADVAAAGVEPGLWLAPFLVAPSSRSAREHPGWILRDPSGAPVVGATNPAWGGEQHVLDTTHPEVRAHLASLGAALTAMGWRYLKLDFTYAAAMPGTSYDPGRTPAQRVRAGFDAIREGAGDDVFLLGCGAPLAPCIGVVDGMRIGPDVAPHWEPRISVPGGLDDAPAVVNAWRNTLARSFMHRRLWLNDPDCLILRADTELSHEQRRAWAYAVAASGGMVLLSDRLASLGSDTRDLLDEVLAVGRAVDEEARAGSAPACPDLVERRTPTSLVSGVATLDGDPSRGSARLTRG